MTLGLLVNFVLHDWNTSYKLSHIFEEFFTNVTSLLNK